VADVVLTFTIPESKVPELVNAFGADYQDTIVNPEDPDSVEMIPNPQSKGEFATQVLITDIKQLIRDVVVRYRIQVSRDGVDSEFDVTAS